MQAKEIEFCHHYNLVPCKAQYFGEESLETKGLQSMRKIYINHASSTLKFKFCTTSVCNVRKILNQLEVIFCANVFF